mmetsp:Transcript_74005/g.228712  ORF Transcript_74005/g.228712 Transcript_74005/m.228712 type:complete len:210 (+) Transcript_74005:1356-1985(+)
MASTFASLVVCAHWSARNAEAGTGWATLAARTSTTTCDGPWQRSWCLGTACGPLFGKLTVVTGQTTSQAAGDLRSARPQRRAGRGWWQWPLSARTWRLSPVQCMAPASRPTATLSSSGRGAKKRLRAPRKRPASRRHLSPARQTRTWRRRGDPPSEITWATSAEGSSTLAPGRLQCSFTTTQQPAAGRCAPRSPCSPPALGFCAGASVL